MFPWLDRAGTALRIVPWLFLVLFGSSQLLVGGILASELFFHPSFLPSRLSTWTTVALLWLCAGFVALLGAGVIVLGVSLIRRRE